MILLAPFNGDEDTRVECACSGMFTSRIYQCRNNEHCYNVEYY